MYAVNVPALPTSPTMPQASVASMIAPQTPSLGRLPTQMVASTIPYAEIKNDARNNPAYAQLFTAAPIPAAVAAEEATSEAGPATIGRISSFPVLFLAQLLGQGMDAEAQSLMVSYEKLQAYADVKYKPSDAGKPQPGNPAMEFLKAMAETNGEAVAEHAPPAPPPPSPARAQPAPSPKAAAAVSRVAGLKAYNSTMQMNEPEPGRLPENESADELRVS